MKAPPWLKVTTPRPQPPGPGLTVNVELVLNTPGKVLSFAWDAARRPQMAWWHRPSVFGAILLWGFARLLEDTP